MLGVSQPGNPPSSLRHSASFSCLQRGSSESHHHHHRNRTSTLPQQPLQLSTHQYGGLSSLPHHQTQINNYSNDSRNRDVTLDHPYIDSNDYGFVRIRPRLHSTNAILLHEDDHRQVSPTDLDKNLDYYPKDEKNREKNHQNPLKGALVLFTASTSSWWKTKQRDEQQQQQQPSITSSSSERKWSNNKERKWSMNSPDAKWNNGSCSGQDRKWRSLGALLRTPVANNDSQSRSFFYHNASASMIENGENSENSRNNNNNNNQTCYSARVVSKTTQYREKEFSLSNRRLKVGRRLFQEEKRENTAATDEDWMMPTTRNQESSENVMTKNSEENRTTRSNRAQSFYLLDDFLRPQPAQAAFMKCQSSSSGTSYSRSGNNDQRSSDNSRQIVTTTTTTTTTGHNSSQRNVTNITPPRRHNSSSDSLEVATSPLPPPVPPPPPPQLTSSRDRERDKEKHESLREKDVCHCRRCWAILQQKWYHEEIQLGI